MASTLRKLKSLVLAQTTDADQALNWLKKADVPISTADCRTCADPCNEGHEEFPSKFDVDMETQMLGSVKPFRRQVVISTGKSDWDREVTSVEGSLAAYIDSASLPGAPKDRPKPPKGSTGSTPGIFSQSSSTRLSILNGNHHTISNDPDHDTVLVFPDYKIVSDVERSLEGATELWNKALNPAVDATPIIDGTQPESGIHSRPIPYSCVIMLCSHKRRDNRCHLAAGTLENGLIHALQTHGWQVDTQIDHEHLPDISDSPSPKTLANLKRALIIRISHIGGHRYAGNIIINTPQGNSVWYGRVTPHEVESIVVTTIIEGKIIPSLLRGGMNISKPSCKTLHDW